MKKIFLLLVLTSCAQNQRTIHSSIDVNEEQNIDIQDNLPELHYYGELLPVDLLISDSLTIPFGFRLIRVGGDVLNQKMISDTKENNDSIFQVLNKRYGKDWKKNFEKETGKSLNYYLKEY